MCKFCLLDKSILSVNFAHMALKKVCKFIPVTFRICFRSGNYSTERMQRGDKVCISSA